MKGRVLLRADGSNKIGFGHLYRVLALAELLRDKRPCVLVTAQTNEAIESEAKRLGVTVLRVTPFDYPFPNERKKGEEVPFDMEHIVEEGDTVVIDGYWFGVAYQSALKRKGCRLICIDDLADGEFNADVIVNHAPGVRALAYSVPQETQLCLGLDYLILRLPFFKEVSPRRISPVSVYLSFGGSDFYSLTLKFLQQCLRVKQDASFHLLVAENFNPNLLQSLVEAEAANKKKVFLHRNLGGQEISNLIDQCTHALTASSTVALEVVARRLKPMIGYYSDNQRSIYHGLVSEGLAIGVGDLLEEKDLPLADYFESRATLDRAFNNDRLLAIF